MVLGSVLCGQALLRLNGRAMPALLRNGELQHREGEALLFAICLLPAHGPADCRAGGLSVTPGHPREYGFPYDLKPHAAAMPASLQLAQRARLILRTDFGRQERHPLEGNSMCFIEKGAGKRAFYMIPPLPFTVCEHWGSDCLPVVYLQL